MKHLWLFLKLWNLTFCDKILCPRLHLKTNFWSYFTETLWNFIVSHSFKLKNYFYKFSSKHVLNIWQIWQEKRPDGRGTKFVFRRYSRITYPIETKLYRRVGSEKKLQILFKDKSYLLYTSNKALKMCWRHQNFQISSTAQQTAVPSTYPKIQSPKSTGKSTWSSHLRASHLRALFFTLFT